MIINGRDNFRIFFFGYLFLQIFLKVELELLIKDIDECMEIVVLFSYMNVLVV